MDTQLLDAIRIIMREELKPVYAKLREHDDQFKSIDYKFKRQDDKLDAMIEVWQIQKVHREELDDHEVRIQAIEHHIPVIS